MTAELARELPLVHISKNKRVKCRAKQEYYENKIKCLVDMNLPLNLILLACWDAPVEKTNLGTAWGKRRFIKKCLKYYRSQLKNLKREEKRIV